MATTRKDARSDESVIDAILDVLSAEKGQTSISYLRQSLSLDGWVNLGNNADFQSFLEELDFTVTAKKAGRMYRFTVSV